jgi:hypothetical protein
MTIVVAINKDLKSRTDHDKNDNFRNERLEMKALTSRGRGNSAI